MNYYQQCCTLVFAIFGIAIIIDPVTRFVFANIGEIGKRFFFALWYMVVTTPAFVMWFSSKWPLTAFDYYYSLLETYKKVYPELFDSQGNMVLPEEDDS